MYPTHIYVKILFVIIVEKSEVQIRNYEYQLVWKRFFFQSQHTFIIVSKTILSL